MAPKLRNLWISFSGMVALKVRTDGSGKAGIIRTYAESIVERFAHNTTWVETGDVNMRQYLFHARRPGLNCGLPLLNGDSRALDALQCIG